MLWENVRTELAEVGAQDFRQNGGTATPEKTVKRDWFHTGQKVVGPYFVVGTKVMRHCFKRETQWRIVCLSRAAIGAGSWS